MVIVASVWVVSLRFASKAYPTFRSRADQLYHLERIEVVQIVLAEWLQQFEIATQ
jgi:hypothetical protein